MATERKYWIEYAENSAKLLKEGYAKLAKDNGVSADDAKRVLGQRCFSEKLQLSCPSFGIRVDLLIKYLAEITTSTAKIIEPYNPNSPKRKNDGLDFLIIFPLVIPAIICTNDKLTKLKSIKSFQTEWILNPDDLVERWNRKKLFPLTWPNEST